MKKTSRNAASRPATANDPIQAASPAEKTSETTQAHNALATPGAAQPFAGVPFVPVMERASRRIADGGMGDPDYLDIHDIVYSMRLPGGELVAVGFLVLASGRAEGLAVYDGLCENLDVYDSLTPEQAFALGQCFTAAGAEAMGINARLAASLQAQEDEPSFTEEDLPESLDVSPEEALFILRRRRALGAVPGRAK